MEATAQDLPPLIGHLTSEFSSIVERMRVGAETVQKLLMFKEAIEAATMLSTMRFSLPAVPPSAPALVGIGLAVGRDGVMMGTRMVVSAEWVEWIRHLVQAGVLSLPVVGAAVRIQAGQVLLSQARGELPRRVRDALGDGPEVSACTRRAKPEPAWPNHRDTTSCQKSTANGSRSAASPVSRTSTSSVWSWSSHTTRPFTVVATGRWVVPGRVNGTEWS